MTGVTLPPPTAVGVLEADPFGHGGLGDGGFGPVVPERDGERERQERERPYAWVLPALPPAAERVVVALQQRRRRDRGGWWRRAAAGRLGPRTELDREMAAVRELRDLATAVLDRRDRNRYGTVVPVSEVLLLLDDPSAWSELLTLAGLDPAA